VKFFEGNYLTGLPSSNCKKIFQQIVFFNVPELVELGFRVQNEKKAGASIKYAPKLPSARTQYSPHRLQRILSTRPSGSLPYTQYTPKLLWHVLSVH